jgi:hypothetical protein
MFTDRKKKTVTAKEDYKERKLNRRHKITVPEKKLRFWKNHLTPV